MGYLLGALIITGGIFSMATDYGEKMLLGAAGLTFGVLYGWLAGVWATGRAVWRRHYRYSGGFIGLWLGMGVYLGGLGWWLFPDLLPQQVVYDFVDNYQVTARLIDPQLFKIEEWEILGQTRKVLFVHPTAAGNATLVYPVYIEARAKLRTALAVAPGAWHLEGDGVVFEVYVEDDAGMHLLYSRYVDPKHHQQDRAWLPITVDLGPFQGQIVRVILVVSSGPAADRRYDWAGWGTPRIEVPTWPQAD